MKLKDEIIGMIKEESPAYTPVTEETNLYMELGFDSLAFVRFLLKVEERFRISFNITEMEACLQAGRLINIVENKVKEAGYDSEFADITKKL